MKLREWLYVLAAVIVFGWLTALAYLKKPASIPTPYSSGTEDKDHPGCDERDRPSVACDGIRPQ